MQFAAGTNAVFKNALMRSLWISDSNAVNHLYTSIKASTHGSLISRHARPSRLIRVQPRRVLFAG